MTKSAENIEKKIEAQLEKLKQLKAQKQAIEARERTKQKEQQRKDDTRRKILLGSYLIKKMQNEANKEKILAELNEYLTEDRDRKLFNLLKSVSVRKALNIRFACMDLPIQGLLIFYQSNLQRLDSLKSY